MTVDLTPTLLLLWAIVLVTQNASFTLVSRARNSGSDWFHAFAAVFSNGIWFLSQTFIIFSLLDVIERADRLDYTLLFLVYVISTVTGSVAMGKFSRRFLEKGKRRVGHYDDKA